MATTVSYARSFAYLIDSLSGESFPGLEIRVSLPNNQNKGVDLVAHLDTGAAQSVIDGGRIVSSLGIDLMAGPEISLGSVIGVPLVARIHRVELVHPDLGSFTLDAAISTVPIRRNLLGRDFFAHLQIGFREFQHIFHVTAAP